ncbi:NrfD/PsrC family molybdoenzyme membrane anchor subunit [Dankookia sp. P2]|uniref:NrfD/PsrC family molybdoenzyme membrane anchor subunit n=1 Tax=Dankookia sp. P2 TaxID=3423955 RepID=UPI003D66BCD6
MNAVPPPPVANPAGPWRGETYYNVPPVRRSHWNWKVGTYIGLGGMAGAAQMLALLARGRDPHGALRRQAHWLGGMVSAVGAALLVVDLKTPHRFANMLRILRPTSPMSLGTWILSGFGLASAVGSLAELFGARRLARAAQVPAAIGGAGMSVYTAALLSATSTPLWAAEPRVMGARFGSAAFSAGAAALSLGARRRGEDAMADRLDEVALLSAGVGLVASAIAEGRTVAAGVRRPALEWAESLGAIGLAEALPVAGYAAAVLAPGARRELSLAASLALIFGNIVMRNEIIRTGNASADRPRDTFRLAQPRDGRRRLR